MPKAFNVVSQDERETLDLEADGARNGIQVESGGGFMTKYVYISPTVKKSICGSVAVVLLLVVIGAATSSGGKSNVQMKGTWPPPDVDESDYAEKSLIINRDPASLSLELISGTSFMQLSKVTTTTTLNFGDNEKFAEEMHMSTENQLNVSPWKDYEGDDEIGLSLEVVFTHLSVTTQDSGGDFTYYNSLSENGNTDFDAVLQNMVGQKATVDIDNDYEIIDEKDNENSLEEMEQRYSIGTTTGLSAMDQVSQVTNMKYYLPQKPDVLYSPGDSWDVEFETDVAFTGVSTLLGYVQYNGAECAVIKSDFTVDQDANNFLGEDDWEEGVEITDGEIKSTVFWDVTLKIPRYLKTVITLTTELEPEDDMDSAMLIPMTETIESFLSPV